MNHQHCGSARLSWLVYDVSWPQYGARGSHSHSKRDHRLNRWSFRLSKSSEGATGIQSWSNISNEASENGLLSFRKAVATNMSRIGILGPVAELRYVLVLRRTLKKHENYRLWRPIHMVRLRLWFFLSQQMGCTGLNRSGHMARLRQHHQPLYRPVVAKANCSRKSYQVNGS